MMNTNFTTNKPQDLQMLIWQSVSQLDIYQQRKLLDFINSLFLKEKNDTDILLKYAGCISKDDIELMKYAIADCEKIDHHEW